MAKTTLYNQLISLTNQSFGLNSKLFLDDLIESHLHKNPQNITVSELIKIHSWIEAVASLIADNKKSVDAYLSQLKLLEGDN